MQENGRTNYILRILSVFGAVVVGFVVGRQTAPDLVLPDTYAKNFDALVERTRDGDTVTIAVGDNEEAIRYIGVDAPETKHPEKGEQCFGKESSAKNKELVFGQKVRFERDKRNRDHRGRLLRYVWVGERMINLELVRDGYAFAEHFSPNYKYRKQLEEAERDAQRLGKGLWSACQELVSEKLHERKNKHKR